MHTVQSAYCFYCSPLKDKEPSQLLDKHYKAVMTGKIPLDAEDEGLATLSVETSIDEIYEFFKNAIEQYEISVAADFWRRSDLEK